MMSRRMTTIVVLAAVEVAVFSPTSGALQESAPPTAAESQPKSHRMPVTHKFSYSCDAGATVVVYLRETNARVVLGDKSYSMKQVPAASGTRYSDGTVVWWSKGYDGFLEDQTDPNQPVKLAEGCKQVSPPPASSLPTISGNIAYRERIALPENAVLIVQLQDVSFADAPAKVIAEQKITFAGRQVPLPFELPYDATKIDPKHSYSVSARITVDGQLRFLSTSAFPVLTGGNSNRVNILVQPASAALN